jgi:hypothetical protein
MWIVSSSGKKEHFTINFIHSTTKMKRANSGYLLFSGNIHPDTHKFMNGFYLGDGTKNRWWFDIMATRNPKRKFSSYLKENTVHHHHKVQLVNAL